MVENMEIITHQEKNKIIYKKGSALIQMNASVLNTTQVRMVEVFLYNAKKMLSLDSSTRVFQITLAEVRSLGGISNTNLKELKNLIVQLKNIDIEYNVFSKDLETWGTFSIIGTGIEINYVPSKGVVIIDYELPFQIVNQLIRPDRYGYIDLLVVKGLKDKYSIMLYFLARDYIGINSKIFDLIEFKKFIGVGDKYSIFSMLEKRVIIPAFKDVNQKTELDLSYDVIKVGKKKAKIRVYFNIRKGLLYGDGDRKVFKCEAIEDKKCDTVEPKPEQKLNIDKELYDKLITHGLKKVQISEFLNNPDIGLNGIEEGFQYYLKQLDEGKINKNKPAYLYNAINKKWGARSDEQKKDDDKEEFKKLLIKKQDMFENYERYGLNRNDLVNLKSEIVDMFKKIGNQSGVSIWENKDVDYVMR